MKIAIIGAGNVGEALGTRWAHAGHQVTFGVRDPEDPETLALAHSLGPNAKVASVAEAARVAPIVLLATPWSAAKNALAACGDLSGKTVIDCTNPISADLAALTIGHSTSGAEEIAKWAKGAHVVKAFNQTGADNMVSQEGYSVHPVMFVAGDDATRKKDVLSLARDAGFDAHDAGPLTSARMLEPLALLWITLAHRQKLGRDFAFALLRRRK
jgi:NADPH-dependent F420 reductase